MFPPGNAEVAEAVAAHRGYRQAWFAPTDRSAGGAATRSWPRSGRAASTAQGAAGGERGQHRRGGRAAQPGPARRSPASRSSRSSRRCATWTTWPATPPGSRRRPAELDEAVRVFVEIPVRRRLGAGRGRGRGGRPAAARSAPAARTTPRPRRTTSWPGSSACWSRPTCRSRPRPVCTTPGRRRGRPGPAAPARVPEPAGGASRRWSRGPSSAEAADLLPGSTRRAAGPHRRLG